MLPSDAPPIDYSLHASAGSLSATFLTLGVLALVYAIPPVVAFVGARVLRTRGAALASAFEPGAALPIDGAVGLVVGTVDCPNRGGTAASEAILQLSNATKGEPSTRVWEES